MKVRVTRTGGFTGVPFVAEVDVSALAAERATAIREAIEEIDFTAPPPTAPIPDGFRYRIEVWREGGHAELTAGDPFVPPSVRELVLLVEQSGR
jgi:hypothetical protein